MKEFKLKWKGPFKFFEGSNFPPENDPELNLLLTDSGVYLLFYPSAHFNKKTGAYIGKAACLIKRFFEHAGWYLAGDYSIVDTKKFQYKSLGNKEKDELKNNLPSAWAEVKNMEYYFAIPTPPEKSDSDYLYHIEFALIRKFQKLVGPKKVNETHFFLQNGQGGRKGSYPFIINNSGAEEIVKIFGTKFDWVPEN